MASPNSVKKFRTMNIMDTSPNYAESQYYGVYHRFWGVYTVQHHDWLNMVHNMTRLAQFSQQV